MGGKDVRRRLRRYRFRPDGIIASKSVGADLIIVTKRDGQLILLFGEDRNRGGALEFSGVMSRVLLRDPLYLLGIYTRVMLLALAWVPAPRRIYLLGFGGGRLPTIVRAHDDRVIIESTETSATVITFATKYFGVRPDERLQVVAKDGRAYLRDRPGATYDIIWIDCFTGTGRHPSHLSTIEFYALCNTHLADGAVVATNLSQHDKFVGRKIATFAKSFPVSAAYRDRDCCVLFGWNSVGPTLPTIIHAARGIEREKGFSFPYAEYAEQLTLLDPATEVQPLRDSDPPVNDSR